MTGVQTCALPICSCAVNTILTFPNSLLPVSSIESAYAAICHVIPYFELREFWGTETQWEQLFRDLSRNKNKMNQVYDKYGFTDEFEVDLYQNCAGLEFRNWLYFLYLKQNSDNIRNSYLQYVLNVTDNYECLKDNILTEIIRIPRTDRHFMAYYEERKKLLCGFPEADIAIFIHEN